MASRGVHGTLISTMFKDIYVPVELPSRGEDFSDQEIEALKQEHLKQASNLVLTEILRQRQKVGAAEVAVKFH